MSNKPAPRCPGCGKEMKSTGFPEGGWWYRCSCGWKSPADEWSKDRAYDKAMKRWEPVYDGYQGATQSENSLHGCTVYGGGELNFDVPPGRYPMVCQSTRGIKPPKEGE